MRLLKTTIVTTIAVSGILASLNAQQAGFKRTVIQQSKLSVPGREAVTAVAEFQPGATVGRHTHPGEEIGYILEGEVVIEQEGHQPVALGPGKTFSFRPELFITPRTRPRNRPACSPTTSSSPGSRSPRRWRRSSS